MIRKFNININSLRPFQVRVRVINKKGRVTYKEYKIEAKDAKTAGFEAAKKARKQENVKSAKWLYCIDISDGKVCY